MKLRAFLLSRWFYPVLSVAVLLVVYSVYLPRLGFYWDDWPVIYLSRFNNPSVYWDLFYHIRPLSAWTYTLTVPVLGMTPIVWQVFGLLQRWAGVMFLVIALEGIWPHKTWQLRWMGLLLLLFPGFSQQTIPVAYTQHFLSFLLFTASLAGMVWAYRRPRNYWLFTIPSMAAALIHLLTMEYFAGLELLRPLLLWFMLHQKGEPVIRSLGRALRAWIPYAAVLVGFLLFRFVFYNRIVSAPDANPMVLLETMRANPLAGFLRLLEHALQDFSHLMIFVWANAVGPEVLLTTNRLIWISLALGVLIGLAAGWMLLRGQSPVETYAVARGSFYWQAPLLGVLAVLLGGLPVWITDRQIIVGTWSDRFALAPMVGAVILVVWMVDWLGDRRLRQTGLLAVLLGLAISTQMRTVNRYATYWDIMRNYYWQLSWRAPALEKGTAVVGPEMPFALVGDYAIGFALNALYGGELESYQPDYWFVDGGRYLGTEIIKDYQPDIPIEYELWNIKFSGTTSQTVPVTFNNARGCLRVLDPIYHDVLPMSPGDSDLMDLVHTPAAILPEAAHPVPEDIFGPEPPHEWCYYYEKADLARTLLDWPRVTALAEEAAAGGFAPENGAELLPFIQAYAMQGQWEAALEASRRATQLTENMNRPVCNLWNRLAAESPVVEGRQSAVDAARAEFKCPVR